ncbi:MAG: hypothetical protein FWF08_01750 [Oscillospiraceae bacterium]|nr:hypothetical protein [Oscillospiraceae bacterium]
MIKYLILSFLIIFIAYTAFDVLRNVLKKSPPDLPEVDIPKKTGLILKYYIRSKDNRQAQRLFGKDVLLSDGAYVNGFLKHIFDYMRARYDCSDFDLPTIIWLYREFYVEKQRLPEESAEYIKNELLNFKYRPDEPGVDSMCYWSENHQIIFAVSEYLAGMTWPDDIFANDGKTGREHREKARERINAWIELRFAYGFSEWNSSTYYTEDLAAMSVFIRFADDGMMRERMKIILDLLLFDIMSQSFDNVFCAASARAYANNRALGKFGNGPSLTFAYIYNLSDKTNSFGSSYKDADGKMEELFVYLAESGLYYVPEAIKAVGGDTSEKIIKSSSGFDPWELKNLSLLGQEPKQIMAQLGAEALMDADTIKNTLKYFKKTKMFANYLVKDIRYLNIYLFKLHNVLPFLIKKFNPMTNGISIKKAAIYTYRTEHYIMSTAQGYNPGGFCTQENIFSVVLSRDLSFFHHHPARDDRKNELTPGYWTGSGRLPMTAQDENINMAVYRLPKDAGLLELYAPPKYIHAYLPIERYSEIREEGRYVFARLNDAYLALIGANRFEYAPYDRASADTLTGDKPEDAPRLLGRFDLIQRLPSEDEDALYCITEMGSKEKDGDFESFAERIKSNKITFESGVLDYKSGGKKLRVEFGSKNPEKPNPSKNFMFAVNGRVQNLNYPRYDSHYCKGERNDESYTFACGDKSHTVNLSRAFRGSGA